MKSPKDIDIILTKKDGVNSFYRGKILEGEELKLDKHLKIAIDKELNEVLTKCNVRQIKYTTSGLYIKGTWIQNGVHFDFEKTINWLKFINVNLLTAIFTGIIAIITFAMWLGY